MARPAGEQVVIELDRHDKLLVDALRARGVPEIQIVLAYRGTRCPPKCRVAHARMGRA